MKVWTKLGPIIFENCGDQIIDKWKKKLLKFSISSSLKKAWSIMNYTVQIETWIGIY